MILDIDVQKSPDDIPIIVLSGEIDLHTCGPFRDALRSLVDDRFYNIIVDLASVPYLDSAALGVLVDSVRRVREHDGVICLVAATPFVKRAFEITRLVKIFSLFETKDEALASIRSKSSSSAAAI